MTAVIPMPNFNYNQAHVPVNLPTIIHQDSHHNINKVHTQGPEEIHQTSEAFHFSPNRVKKQEEPFKQIENVKEKISIASSVRLACRICLMGKDDDPSFGNLINVCACKGSIGYLHFECLKDSLDRKYGKTKKTNFETPISFKESSNKVRKEGIKIHKCEICSEQYQVMWNSKLVKRPPSQYCEKKKCFAISLFIFLFGFISFLTAFSLFMKQI